MKTPSEIAVSLNDLMKLEYLVSGFSLLSRQPVHSVLSGKHASKLRGRGLDFSEVRKYVFGDDIRNIDWRVTARTKQTHTKVFNEEKERPAFILLDQSASMFFASTGRMKSVIAAELAAIAGFKVLKESDRIGGLVFDDENYDTVKPKRSRAALMHFLDLVVKRNNALVERKKINAQESFINKVLFKTKNTVTHDYVVMIISDFKELDDQGRIYLSEIARHNDVIAAMISDDMEMDLPADKLPVTDGEYQVILKDEKGIRSRFSAASEDLRTKNLNFLNKYGIPVMEFNTSEPLADQIKRIFGNR